MKSGPTSPLHANSAPLPKPGCKYCGAFKTKGTTGNGRAGTDGPKERRFAHFRERGGGKPWRTRTTRTRHSIQWAMTGSSTARTRAPVAVGRPLQTPPPAPKTAHQRCGCRCKANTPFEETEQNATADAAASSSLPRQAWSSTPFVHHRMDVAWSRGAHVLPGIVNTLSCMKMCPFSLRSNAGQDLNGRTARPTRNGLSVVLTSLKSGKTHLGERSRLANRWA